MKIKMKELPISERPYEKLEKYGSDSLSDAELLGIIIKSGVRGENSVQVAQRVINQNTDSKGFYFLERMSIDELTKIKGIGKVKAIELISSIELGKRIFVSGRSIKKEKWSNPKNIYLNNNKLF